MNITREDYDEYYTYIKGLIPYETFVDIVGIDVEEFVEGDYEEFIIEDGFPEFINKEDISSSSLSTLEESYTIKIKSASSIFLIDLLIPIDSIISSLSLIPAVSNKFITIPL